MGEPIRVLHMPASMNRGGAETMIMNYYRHIDRSRVQFDFLLTTEGPYDYGEEIVGMGGQLFQVPPLTKTRPTDYMGAVNRFFKEHPDYRIVHAHTSSKSALPLHIAKKNGVPVRIAHSHSSQSEGGIDGVIRNMLMAPLKRSATEFWACGREAALWLYGEKLTDTVVKLVPNAIDAAAYTYHAETAAAVRQELSIPAQTPVLGHVGRFVDVKNHAWLLKVLAKVVEQRSDARLLLVGDGPMMDAVREQAQAAGLSEQVVFAGMRGDVPRLLQAMDVFVMPSLVEGVSVAAMEAQAAGLPCVFSACVPPENDVAGRSCFLSLDEPAEVWAQAVLSSADGIRKDTASLIAAAGYDIVTQAAWMQEEYLRLYHEHARI